jgi:hypothetical protein
LNLDCFMKLCVLQLGHGVFIGDENIATPFRLTMKVFSRDDNIVNLYRLEMKALSEHEGIAKVHGRQ